ncbi:MAG TPA: hypothetical protein VEY09_14945 [Pyrinomonadaceae bacterium]|nr:hypothetical protein [Pyrinomonadaceae bacterium]
MTDTALRYLSGLGVRLHQAALLRFRRGAFSNFDEEAIIARFVAEHFPPGHAHTAVDLGAGDGIKSSNTYALFRQGWRGLGVEGDEGRAFRLAQAYRHFPGAAAVHARVTPDNVAGLLRAHAVENDFGLLSLDIDSYDYWVLDAVLAEFRPRLVVSEINEKIPPPVKFVLRFDPDFRMSHHFYGYSIQSLEDLCARRGYSIVGLEYNNVFLAPAETPGIEPLTPAEAYRRGYLERPDRRRRFPQNEDMEALHGMSPAEALAFLESFYSRHRGKFELSL